MEGKCVLRYPGPNSGVRFVFGFVFLIKKYCLTNHSGSVILVMFLEVVSVMKRDANNQDGLEPGIGLLRLPPRDRTGGCPGCGQRGSGQRRLSGMRRKQNSRGLQSPKASPFQLPYLIKPSIKVLFSFPLYFS